MTGLNEQLRRVTLKQIAAGRMSVSLLARKSGYSEPHLCEWLKGGKGLSLAAFECVLESVGFAAELFPQEKR